MIVIYPQHKTHTNSGIGNIVSCVMISSNFGTLI
ncbi:hypothetical protein CpipJ_CPIJ013696 [Culex quinquefasciatus]|uniref:Uncharacterized protein n=1 Tax=Culex quinquefasciatus TaxID=7176 RepID=B0X307_CULQU|nr:hypothetical protein CpipJ_CPIJ013696 [Culex quinquefasciatus]|eukprot:XP_001864029.1 hypothetical protein CpipJ_CPIJ013696 [Culex quinquefasciatus]